MPTIESSLFPPPTRAAAVDPKGFIGVPFRQWLFSLQKRSLLWLIDTSAGPYNQALPPAGLNSTTGQSNQNQEIWIKKISADANIYTFTAGPGALFPEGPRILQYQYDSFKVKSDGTTWWLFA